MSKSDDMPDNLSAIADGVNIRFKGRAIFFAMAEKVAMTDAWRTRLKEALGAAGKSKREISLKAGCSPGYLHDVLEAGKEPTLDRLLRVAEALDISLSWLIYGVKIDREDEELLSVFAKLSERQRQAILDLTNLEPDNDR